MLLIDGIIIIYPSFHFTTTPAVLVISLFASTYSSPCFTTFTFCKPVCYVYVYNIMRIHTVISYLLYLICIFHLFSFLSLLPAYIKSLEGLKCTSLHIVLYVVYVNNDPPPKGPLGIPGSHFENQAEITWRSGWGSIFQRAAPRSEGRPQEGAGWRCTHLRSGKGAK